MPAMQNYVSLVQSARSILQTALLIHDGEDVKTIAQQSMTRKERPAFGLMLRAVAMQVAAAAVACAAVNPNKHCSFQLRSFDLIKSVSRFIGSNWKRSISIRGENPLVANG
jgi:hypothetical protein